MRQAEFLSERAVLRECLERTSGAQLGEAVREPFVFWAKSATSSFASPARDFERKAPKVRSAWGVGVRRGLEGADCKVDEVMLREEEALVLVMKCGLLFSSDSSLESSSCSEMR